MLIVSGGGFQGLAVVRGLSVVPGVRIVVADALSDPLTAPLADDIVRVPMLAARQAFDEAVVALARRVSARLVIPATERELQPLAELAGAFEAAGARVAVSSAAALATFRDRLTLHEALRAAGLPVLPRLDPRESSSGDLPLLGKPRREGWGGRGQRIVRTASELAAASRADDLDDWLWQPWLAEFREHSIDFAVGFEGELSPVVVRERLRTSGGFCVVASSTTDAAVVALAQRVARFAADVGGRGLFNAQVLEHGGELSVSDLNPRVGTSAVFTLGAGVNLAGFLCRSAGATELVEVRADVPVRMTRVLEERFTPQPAFEASALLFDLDDTLLDHKRWIFAKLEALWEERRLELPPRERFLRAAWRAIEEEDRARTIDVLVRDLELPAALREPLIETYRRLEPPAAPLYPDVVGALTAFRERGLRLALVTDNPPASQRQKLAVAGLEPLFDAVVFTREMGGEKPEPAGVRAAVEQLGVSPREVAMVGDQPLRDGEAALAAGLGRYFWMRRGGGLFDVHEGLLTRVAPELARFTVPVRDLRELANAIRPR